MAGDWLKVEAVTPDKPEVFEIAVQLKITPAEAFGRLFLVWRWFDQQTEDGNGGNVTSAYLDHIAGVTGFAEAMRMVGWLEGGSNGQFGLRLPNFDRHNGKTAKSRALTAKRVTTHKTRTANAKVTQAPLPREEKRREEEETLRQFGRFWSAYPKRVAKQDALKAWRKHAMTFEQFERVMAFLEREKASEQWQRDSGRFIPHAATWLNRETFDEEAPAQGPKQPAPEPCQCGAMGTVKVGGEWRCEAHIRGLEAVA